MKQWDIEYSATRRAIMKRLPLLSRWAGLALGKLFELTFTRAVVGDKFMLRLIQGQCRKHLASVKDAALRAKLTPNYEPACRRLIFSDDFYEAVQRPGVELVTEGIDHIEPRGVVTKDGRLHELDVLVLATGFHAHNYMRPMKVIGDGGVDLDEVWSGGATAYRSVAVPGFQNFFMLIGPHSPIGNYSLITIAELQVSYIMELIDLWRDGKANSVEPRADATQSFNAAMREQMKNTVWTTGCTSWYLDASGFPALWPWTFARFRREMQKADLSAFELKA